jgi:hypothetical protein
MDANISIQSGLSDRSLNDRMQAIESQLAGIAASGIPGTHPIHTSAQSAASATPFSAYPMPPAEYVVYDHTSPFMENFYSPYNTVRQISPLHPDS